MKKTLKLLEKDTKFTKLDDQILEFHHFLLHRWYMSKLKSNLPKEWSLDELEQKHFEIHKELDKRKNKKTPKEDNDLDKTLDDE